MSVSAVQLTAVAMSIATPIVDSSALAMKRSGRHSSQWISVGPYWVSNSLWPESVTVELSVAGAASATIKPVASAIVTRAANAQGKRTIP
jgi:hypothetical protein